MRTIISTVTLSLAFILSCGDDNAPTRPQDGTVKAWETCVWDGQEDFNLCTPETACVSNGVCAPRCTTAEDCPAFEGFEVECSEGFEVASSEDPVPNVCRVRCNDARECPKTGGAEIHCIDFHCVRDP